MRDLLATPPRSPPAGGRAGARRGAGGGIAGALLLGGLLLTSCAGQPLEEGSGVRRPRKSALVGELLAVFPGFFVHGLGHRYAGNEDRAEEILAMELYSFLPMGLGGLLYGIGRAEDAEAVEVAGWVGIGVGAVPFLGTWIYDMVYTPSEIERYNRGLDGAAMGRPASGAAPAAPSRPAASAPAPSRRDPADRVDRGGAPRRPGADG